MFGVLVLSRENYIQNLQKLFASVWKVALAALIFAFSFSVNAHAVDEVGQSVKIRNDVKASIGDRRLKARDPVFDNEKISAGAESHGEILLNDRSRVLVGENSIISLDEFTLGTRGFSSGSIKVAKGAFRFITGNSKKGFMTVETPKSTIGVRGTAFDVYVADSGVTRVVLFRGEVEVCSRSNCITINRPCDVAEVDDADAHELPYLRSGERAEENISYELTTAQKRFRAAWRAPVFICAIRAAIDPDRLPEKPDNQQLDGIGPVDPAPQFTPDPCASLQKPVLENGLLLASLSTNGQTFGISEPDQRPQQKFAVAKTGPSSPCT